VIDGRWQSESVFDQVHLPGFVSARHGLQLRYSHVGFIYDEQEIIRKIIKDGVRRLTR
jgi:hypothetical protein